MADNRKIQTIENPGRESPEKRFACSQVISPPGFVVSVGIGLLNCFVVLLFYSI